MTSTSILSDLTTALTLRQAMPLKLEYADIGDVRLVNVFDTIESEIITDSICSGMDTDLATAAIKALVERVERSAFQFGFDSKYRSCLTTRSDGFAAYPKVLFESEKIVRANAYNEALERFAWASWWDDRATAYTCEIKNAEDKVFWSKASDFISELQTILDISSLKIVKPSIENLVDKEVVIIFTEIFPFGVISGGACGDKKNLEQVIFRAMGELFRHGCALFKMQTKNLKPQSFYEKRLQFFGTLAGFKIYKDRLAQVGNQKIILPELQFDEKIDHPLSDIVSVHRCLFENQPPFVGGALDRLCL